MTELDHLTVREFENHTKYMKESFDDIKTNMHSSFEKINNKLDDLPNRFVTKDEFKPIREEVTTFRVTLRNVVMGLIGSLISALLYLASYIWHIVT